MRSSTRNSIVWTLSALLAAASVVFAGMVLAHVDPLVGMLDAWGYSRGMQLGLAFASVVGSGIALIPRAAVAGAVILVCVALSHVAALADASELSVVGMPAAFGIAAAIVGVLRWPEFGATGKTWWSGAARAS